MKAETGLHPILVTPSNLEQAMTEEQIATIAQKIHLELSDADAEDSILDELVYDTACSDASNIANQGPEDEAEEHIEDGESLASDVNNRGWIGQIAWLLENGVSEEEIRTAIKTS